MALKNFTFKENWLVSKVAGKQIALLVIFNQPGPIFWLQKPQIWNSLNRILIFNPLERQKLYYYQLCDLKTD